MSKNRYYSGPVTDHFDGVRFYNPDHPSTDRSGRDIWRWWRERNRAVWPDHVAVVPNAPLQRVEAIRITMVGHATLLIQAGGLNILTDPVWSKRASPFSFAGPARVTPPGVRFDDLPPIDAVLISHNHYDHLDIRTLRGLHDAFAPRMFTPLGNDTIIRSAIPAADVWAGDWYQSIDAGPGGTLTITPAHHWSSRTPSDRRMALWGGFHLRTQAGAVWFAGDTGYGNGAIFRDMRDRLGPPDVALIPIGAYEPRWFMADQHTDPEDAVRVFRDIGARHALGIHWGTFQLTDEAREAPAVELQRALARLNLPEAAFRPAGAGEHFDFSPSQRWRAPTTAPPACRAGATSHRSGLASPDASRVAARGV